MADSRKNKENEFLVFVEDDVSFDAFNAIDWNTLELKVVLKKGTIKEAVAYLVNNSSPHYLAIDLSSSKLPISDMQKVANACDPGINVLTIGTRNDVGLFRDLISLGVRDYIAKPLNQTLLMRSIMRLVKGVDADMGVNFLNPGQSIGFIGVSGGAGSSTIAANVASHITQEYKKSVALLDMDLRFSGSSKLYTNAIKAGFRELLESSDVVESVMVQRSMTMINDNLHVIGGDESIDEPLVINPQAFQDINKHLKADFQYVFYDIPFGEVCNYEQWFLNTFNTLVVVATPTMFQVRDASRLINHLKKTCQVTNRIILTLNQVGVHKNGEISHEAFEKAVSHTIDETISFDPYVLLGSMNTGVPAVESKGKFLTQIDHLSRRLIGNYEDILQASSTRAPGKLSRLLNWGKPKA